MKCCLNIFKYFKRLPSILGGIYLVTVNVIILTGAHSAPFRKEIPFFSATRKPSGLFKLISRVFFFHYFFFVLFIIFFMCSLERILDLVILFDRISISVSHETSCFQLDDSALCGVRVFPFSLIFKLGAGRKRCSY